MCRLTGKQIMTVRVDQAEDQESHHPVNIADQSAPVEPPIVDAGLIAAMARIELEILSLDKQRQALKMAIEILRQRSGATPE